MIHSKIIWAGILTAGLFVSACGNNDKNTEPSKPIPVKLESVALDTFPFDCDKDSLVPMGFINRDWHYNNQRLGIHFKFPEGWNAIEDINNNNPMIVPVKGDLTEFRDRYTHPQTLKLSVMMGNPWDEKRYLFGITKLPPKHVMDETPLDLAAEPLATAELFYGKEFKSEESLYKFVISSILDDWHRERYDGLIQLNQASIKSIKRQRLGNVDFYSHSIKIPTEKSVITSNTLVKKLDCFFLVISYTAKDQKERNAILEGLKGLEVRR